MGRLYLDPGTWDLDVTLTGPGGERVDGFTINGVVVESARSQFINYRIY